jgi:hypothetical protein
MLPRAMQPDAVRPLLCAINGIAPALRGGAMSIALCAFTACAPEIGDECKTSLDCSSQGSRLCDRTQPHGYCTLRGCESGTCPEDSVCVKFRPAQERLAITYCMAKCSDDDDCRSDEGYRCSGAMEFGEAGLEAEILGNSDQQFCSADAVMSLQPVDDAGGDPGAGATPDAATDAGGGGTARDGGDDDSDAGE